jgi:acetoin utilization deacetylase AcuC-like enzyme
MTKYELLYQQLLHEGIVSSEEMFRPKMLEICYAELVHDKDYLQQLVSGKLSAREQRKTGFELTPLLVERELYIMSGTLQAALYALENGKHGFNIAGGTHHAYANRGEGFCLLNDFAIAAAYLIHKKLVGQVLVVDLDVHQGNGTARIFSEESRVFTFSMHGRDNYPLKKEESDLDVALKTGTEDQEYLQALSYHLEELIENLEPDVVFYQCGVDVLGSDKLGKLNLTLDGCRERDVLVYSQCSKNEIPVVAAMGGGYSQDLNQIVQAHKNTFEVARDFEM